MIKDVTVTVVGLQRMSREDDRAEPVELVTRGRLRDKDGRYYLKYDEYFEDLTEPVHNLIKFDEEGLELTKKGDVNASMSFCHKQTTKAFYSTLEGTLDISILTEGYSLECADGCMDVSVVYIMDYGNEYITFNVLRMRIEW